MLHIEITVMTQFFHFNRNLLKAGCQVEADVGDSLPDHLLLLLYKGRTLLSQAG